MKNIIENSLTKFLNFFKFIFIVADVVITIGIGDLVFTVDWTSVSNTVRDSSFLIANNVFDQASSGLVFVAIKIEPRIWAMLRIIVSNFTYRCGTSPGFVIR